jgi:hypothetical protein
VAAEGRDIVNLSFILDIPWVSSFAFWYAIAAYIILASSR